MSRQPIDLLVRRHGVPPGCENPFAGTAAGADAVLTEFQVRLIRDEAPVRIASAPTGAGKTYAFELAPLIGQNVLFVVPTRRLAQNLEQAVRGIMGRNGWGKAEVEGRLAVWTSDAMEEAMGSGLTAAEVRSQRVRQLRGLGGFRDDGTFIIATPESVGRLLLNPPVRDSGQPSMSLMDLLSRHHIVFDEFHTIEARGFGLAAALCLVTSGLSVAGPRPQVTFLSATPLDIAGALAAFEVPETQISLFEECVESWRPGEEPPGGRIVHGDVEVSLGRYADILEACRAEGAAITRTLQSGRTVVVILDSVAKLKAERDALSALFQAHGLAKHDILTINSIDDAHHEFQDEHGAGGRSADPLRARAILATSGVEVGVTFNAGLMIMDPGHGPCSFIQRVGRVSRGDLPGRVVVASSAPADLLGLLRRLDAGRTAPDAPAEIDVEHFVGAVLRNVAREFSCRTDQAAGDLQTYGTMSNCAVWCACLFWSALRRVWGIYAGERATLRGFQPRKVGAFERKLKAIENSGLERPKEWVRAFIREAAAFREIEPRVRVRHAGRIDSVPESMVGRYPELSGSPIIEDADGFCIELRRPLESILRTGDTRPFRPTLQPMAPLDGMALPSLPRRSAPDAFVQALKRVRRHPFGENGDKLCKDVSTLVRMTGVVPREGEEEVTAAHEGSGVV